LKYIVVKSLFFTHPSLHKIQFGGSTPKFTLTKLTYLLIISLLTAIPSCNPQPAYAETGIASFYGNGEKLNKHTANGEVFDPDKLTCATYNYPFNTYLKVTNLSNDKSVIVRVNDRGPNKRLNRVIDLSRGAFEKIAPLHRGIINIRISEL